MGTFNIGDRVANGGHTATVIGSTETVSLKWDANGYTGIWPASAFTLIPRKFKVGQFVRVLPAANDETVGEVGFLYADDGDPENQDPYWVALLDDDESENPYSSDELEAWFTLVGERVVEAEEAEGEAGTVIGIGDPTRHDAPQGVVRVLWDSFPQPQNWFARDLEPAEEYDDGFEVGDTVEYSNPFLAEPLKGTVIQVDDSLGVNFHTRPDLNGFYDSSFFSKAA
jgi:hypothetical protein